jgi:hypothetical protein
MKRVMNLLMVALAATAMVTCSDDDITGPVETGIRLSGTVRYTRCPGSGVPVLPPQPYRDKCPVPVTVTATEVSSDESYRTTTDSESQYELNLPPGKYVMETESYSWLTQLADTVELVTDTTLDLIGIEYWSWFDTVTISFYYIGSDTLSSDSEIVLLEILNRSTGNHLDLAGMSSRYNEDFRLRTYDIPHDLEIHPYFLEAALNQSIANDVRGIYPYKTYATLSYVICAG